MNYVAEDIVMWRVNNCIKLSSSHPQVHGNISIFYSCSVAISTVKQFLFDPL